MQIDTSSLSPQECYRLISGIVVPRPIAWITSQSLEGLVNLAPFSCFTFVSNSPLMVGINIGRKAGREKDTARNIRALGEFVINIADWSMVEDVHASAVEYESHESEVESLGLAVMPSETIVPPRLMMTPISLECQLHSVTAYGNTGAEFFVGEVARVHIDDALYENGRIDTRVLQPVCRIAGANYATLGEIRELQPVSQTPKTIIESRP
ncbi:Nitrilotriacetate monooxygenase component B [Alloalcanivorax dieselolei B5]|uniref:Nitrilotriacetate monooxygenase component B n=1 Tax=Alcanivorax dieselolei (strain DSM 16502 / CGMCC 1.3690 / MCCC 1A00001 / B-5) TaxID=930169 RepID=K0CDJ2_ALCDB|nr:flavin reductase family protein [Alloalcanivorax dieselolei]AFT69641.1 Nitrilotriacetate monooxygenase component B [Alloalcanivorax dieselolei B5]GGK03495.1 flavin reductase [Alloalcanivorax dieselolei]